MILSTAVCENSNFSENGSVPEDENMHISAQHLKLKGQMMLLDNGNKLIYLCSPYVTSIPELLQYGLRLSAIPLHDGMIL